MGVSEDGHVALRSVAHFRIVDKLGEGGMGIVYKARDEKLGRVVALKVLPDDFAADAERRHRFMREAKSAAAVTHPNIATVYEIGEHDARIYIAMEYVEGRSLRALLEDGPLPIERALRIARGILTGLAKAHGAGVIHRDLKPDNVMVCDDDHVKILDFGLAKVEDASGGLAKTTPHNNDAPTVLSHATKEGRLLGTPQYMSPEQASGRAIDRRTDLFSMGIVLFEMLTGTRPFGGTTALEVIAAIQRDTPPAASSLNGGVSPALDRILERSFAKEPARRYATCREMIDDLVSSDAVPVAAAPVTVPAPVSDPSPSPSPSPAVPAVPPRFFLPIVIAVAVIAGAFAAFAFVAQPPRAGANAAASMAASASTSAPTALASAPASVTSEAASATPPPSSAGSAGAPPTGAPSVTDRAADVRPATSVRRVPSPAPSAAPTAGPAASASAKAAVPGMSESQK